MFKFLTAMVLMSSMAVAAGTTYVPVYNPATAMPEADGMFKCGGRVGKLYDTEANAITCSVIDLKNCKGFFMSKENCKTVDMPYSQYAEFRAKLEKQKVRYLGLAPMYVGRDSEFRVFVFVKIIPQ